MGLSDTTDAPPTALDESLFCSSGGFSSDAGSGSALGFGLDRFRGPMKQAECGGGESESSDLLWSFLTLVCQELPRNSMCFSYVQGTTDGANAVDHDICGSA